MKPTHYSPEELKVRLCDASTQSLAVRAAMGDSPAIFNADDWTKARAFEDICLMALQMSLQPEGSSGIEIAREVSLAYLKLARQSMDHPIAGNVKGLAS